MPLSCFPSDVHIWTATKSYSNALIPFVSDHYDSVFLSVSTVISFLPAAASESPVQALSTAQSHGAQAKEEINRENIAAGSHIFIWL